MYKFQLNVNYDICFIGVVILFTVINTLFKHLYLVIEDIMRLF